MTDGLKDKLGYARYRSADFESTLDVVDSGFVTSQILKKHPVIDSKPKLRSKYYAVLKYFVESLSVNKTYTNARLEQYLTVLVGNDVIPILTDSNRSKIIRSVVNDFLIPWRKKYRYWLLCDLALILLDYSSINNARKQMSGYLSYKKANLLEELYNLLHSDEPIPLTYSVAGDLIKQFRVNRKFISQPMMRFMVTANMSAGKSTLINALIGKPLTRTSQEACTANLTYLFNKPFEDGSVHLLSSSLKLCTSYDELVQMPKTDVSNVSNIASFFRALDDAQGRVCLIDTPGVNSSINREHGKLTKSALREESYDRLIYVFNANRLGTDEEIRHLKFVADNVPKDKIIFVLNKLDSFNKNDDSIEKSIEGIRNDLLEIGFENPIICPLSAYFALLIKMKQNGDELTEDEIDDFEHYKKKFSKPEYDLSWCYGFKTEKNDDLTTLAYKCGLYGFENILYGAVAE